MNKAWNWILPDAKSPAKSLRSGAKGASNRLDQAWGWIDETKPPRATEVAAPPPSAASARHRSSPRRVPPPPPPLPSAPSFEDLDAYDDFSGDDALLLHELDNGVANEDGDDEDVVATVINPTDEADVVRIRVVKKVPEGEQVKADKPRRKSSVVKKRKKPKVPRRSSTVRRKAKASAASRKKPSARRSTIASLRKAKAKIKSSLM